VLSCFDKTLQEDEDRKLPSFVAFQDTPRKRTRIPVDVDQGAVMDAELYLQGIHEQAADHLEHDEVEEALELFKSVLSSHRDKYGDIHHLVGTANHNIGMVFLFAQQYLQAMHCFQEAVSVRRAALGPDHPAVAASMMKIGMIFLLQRDPDSAKEMFLRILKLVRKSLGSGHLQVARALNNIAVSQYHQGGYLNVLRTFQEAHDIQRSLLHLSRTSQEGSSSSSSSSSILQNQTKTIELALANTLSNMGFLHCRQKLYTDSLKLLQEADILRRKHGGFYDPDVGCTEENLRYVKGLVGDSESQEPVSSPFDQLLANVMDKIQCVPVTP
jgi:tetratricopeptide (TPR) repeat protein